MKKKSGHIELQSLSAQALSILKSRILDGEIPQGSRFVVDVLANELGISRTPVREALSKLVSMGLVTYDGKSYMVASYTALDVKELFAIRRSLEVLAIQEVAKYPTHLKVTKFRLMCERLVKIRRDIGEDMKLRIELDTVLHKLIYKSSNNAHLEKILFDIWEKIQLIHKWGYLTKKVEYMETATIEEYLEFSKYLESRDSEKAAQLMEQHLILGEQFTLECLGLSTKAAFSPQQNSDSTRTKKGLI